MTTGIGISEEHREILFPPFTRLPDDSGLLPVP